MTLLTAALSSAATFKRYNGTYGGDRKHCHLDVANDLSRFNFFIGKSSYVVAQAGTLKPGAISVVDTVAMMNGYYESRTQAPVMNPMYDIELTVALDGSGYPQSYSFKWKRQGIFGSREFREELCGGLISVIE